jgi:hypothetical protein
MVDVYSSGNDTTLFYLMLCNLDSEPTSEYPSAIILSTWEDTKCVAVHPLVPAWLDVGIIDEYKFPRLTASDKIILSAKTHHHQS